MKTHSCKSTVILLLYPSMAYHPCAHSATPRWPSWDRGNCPTGRGGTPWNGCEGGCPKGQDASGWAKPSVCSKVCGFKAANLWRMVKLKPLNHRRMNTWMPMVVWKNQRHLWKMFLSLGTQTAFVCVPFAAGIVSRIQQKRSTCRLDNAPNHLRDWNGACHGIQKHTKITAVVCCKLYVVYVTVVLRHNLITLVHVSSFYYYTHARISTSVFPGLPRSLNALVSPQWWKWSSAVGVLRGAPFVSKTKHIFPPSSKEKLHKVILYHYSKIIYSVLFNLNMFKGWSLEMHGT